MWTSAELCINISSRFSLSVFYRRARAYRPCSQFPTLYWLDLADRYVLFSGCAYPILDWSSSDTSCGRTNLNYTGSSTRVHSRGLQRASNGIIPWLIWLQHLRAVPSIFAQMILSKIKRFMVKVMHHNIYHLWSVHGVALSSEIRRLTSGYASGATSGCLGFLKIYLVAAYRHMNCHIMPACHESVLKHYCSLWK
jgi:hypothetical protein